jgi:hypothetical protein
VRSVALAVAQAARRGGLRNVAHERELLRLNGREQRDGPVGALREDDVGAALGARATAASRAWYWASL